MLDRTVKSEARLRPVRIGILGAPEGFRESWQLRTLDRLTADQRFEIAAILLHPHAYPARREPRLYRYVEGLERAIIPNERPYIPSHFTLAGGLVHNLQAAGMGLDETAAGALIEALDLDLVIRMIPAKLGVELTARVPFGEWSLSMVDQCGRWSDWVGFSDIIARQPSTRLTLSFQRGSREGCIAEAAFNVKFSAVRNAGFVKERAVTLLMRELGRLAETGRIDDVDMPPEQPRLAPPTKLEVLRYAGLFSMNLLGRAYKRLKAKAGIGSTVWTLYEGKGDIAGFEPQDAIEIPPSRREIRADPFLFEYQGDQYLFYEAYAAGARKAHIAVGRLDNSKLTPLGPALVKEHHLSYPFVFSHAGEIFMMPETNQARRAEIWRCVEFPLKWVLHSTALEGQSPADSCLTEIDGRWWLFTNLSDYHAYEDHCSELHVFAVDGPDLKSVLPHPANPVVIGSNWARNAGRIFSIDGRLYRPSQRNEHGIYGYGLNIMEIDALDLETYREHCVRVIRPDFKPGLIGCHHFDACGGRFVIDARLGH